VASSGDGTKNPQPSEFLLTHNQISPYLGSHKTGLTQETVMITISRRRKPMNLFVRKHDNKINVTLCCFYRIFFRGVTCRFNPAIRRYHITKGNEIRPWSAGIHPPSSRDDIQLFKAMIASEHFIRGLTNSDIHTRLKDSPHLRDLANSPKGQSAKVSQIVGRFYAHRLIAKIRHRRRCRVTGCGKQIMTASLCLRDVAFLVLFRKNIAVRFILQKNKEVAEKKSIH
jgi:hypothetical protein